MLQYGVKNSIKFVQQHLHGKIIMVDGYGPLS